MIIITIIFIIILIYRIGKTRKSLGKVKYSIPIKFKKVAIVSWSILAILNIMMVISYINNYRVGGTIFSKVYYRENIIEYICWAMLSIINIVLNFKNAEIREGGINTFYTIYKWENINCYKMVDKDRIEIITSKKTLFKNKNKKIKWDIEQDSINGIEEILLEKINICDEEIKY
ncbi:hypothetical protein [Dethiothermospora halolimnae]|uniref:hypothetical protein n=1 Tax=Dethiothermospora halolimnae TaxID=3114390 RepID=UPI003CCBAE19